MSHFPPGEIGDWPFHSPAYTCRHKPSPVQIGGGSIYAASGLILKPEDMMFFELRILLRHEMRIGKPFGHQENGFLWLPIVDYQTVEPKHWHVWKQRLTEVQQMIEADKKVLVFCAGGHGRTGLFLASLLALAEPDVVDPVTEIRHRYCQRAVEREEQERSISRMLRETRAALTGA